MAIAVRRSPARSLTQASLLSPLESREQNRERYHGEVDGRYYSVPYHHLGDRVEVRLAAATVEVILAIF